MRWQATLAYIRKAALPDPSRTEPRDPNPLLLTPSSTSSRLILCPCPDYHMPNSAIHIDPVSPHPPSSQSSYLTNPAPPERRPTHLPHPHRRLPRLRHRNRPHRSPRRHRHHPLLQPHLHQARPKRRLTPHHLPASRRVPHRARRNVQSALGPHPAQRNREPQGRAGGPNDACGGAPRGAAQGYAACWGEVCVPLAGCDG